MYFNKCLVTSISFITFGPNESGVTYMFPSPTIKISSSFATCLSTNFFNSSDKTLPYFSISSSVAIFNLFISIVI